MTDTLRSGRNTQLAYGKVSQPVIFVEVQWEWLTLPFAVAVGAILFLIFTVWSTCRAQVVLWKTSMLALLFHHLDQSEDLNGHDTLVISDVQNYEDLKALVRSKSMALAI
ncbi:hypothetical protein MAP00_000757 [Monascus purpureus]|nr:hypothetical protein MAP00_000757 [Monascus purpureus]